MYFNEYDPFNFMMVLLFIYVILIGFIMIIIYNKKHSVKNLLESNKQKPQTTCSNCIPTPTNIKG